MLDPRIPRVLQDVVQNELESGERIEWIGTPRPVFFTAASVGIVLFAIPWTAFALFWMGAAGAVTMFQEETGWFEMLFPMFGLPFVLVGIGMLSTPWWVYRKALYTVYVITQHRAIIFEGKYSTKVRSFGPKDLEDIFRNQKRNGTGDVIFSRDVWRDSDGDRHTQQVGFLRIDDPQDVERRLRSLTTDS